MALDRLHAEGRSHLPHTSAARFEDTWQFVKALVKPVLRFPAFHPFGFTGTLLRHGDFERVRAVEAEGRRVNG